MPPTQLTPVFGAQPAPFQPQPPVAQQRGGFDPSTLLALAGGLQGFLQAGQRGGLAEALLGGAAGGLGGFAQGQQQQFEREDVLGQRQTQQQQQLIENALAKRKADVATAKQAESVRQFGVSQAASGAKERRLASQFGTQQNLAERKFARGPADPLVEVFDPTSPSGSRLTPRSEAAGLPGAGTFSGTGLTPGKAEELTASAGGLRLAQTKLQRLRDDISANPQRAGAVGSVNKAFQTAGGIARDVAELIPGVGSIAESLLGPAVATESQEVQDFLSDPSLEANQAAANSLAYALALSRKQGKRVTVQDVNTAKGDLKITGLKSSKQVVARMDELLREIDQGIGLIEQRVGASGAATAQPVAPSGGETILRFDAQGNPVQ